jgi:hypothetical protein
MTTKVPAELSSTPSISDSGNATAITIDSSERVGILQSSPTSNLHIGATGNDAKRELRLDGTNGSGQTYGCIIQADGENGRFVFKVGQSGNTPAQQFMVHPDGGICFGSDTAAANALDDYEEGTWTITEVDGEGGTMTGNRVNYTKIGNMVHAWASITVGTTSSNNRLDVSLPFTSSINGYYLGGGGVSYNNLGSSYNLNLRPSIENAAASVFFLYGDGSTASTSLTCAQASGKRIDFFVSYRV